MGTRSNFRLNSFLVCGLIGAAAVGSVHAQSPSGAQGLLDNAWVFNLGTFTYGTSLKAGLNGESTNNPDVDFDETFGAANDATRVRADVLWRISPKHRLRAMYFDNSTSRTRTLDEDVKWGDYTFGSGSRATFDQEFSALAVAYEYAFTRTPTYELAASLGVHYMDIELQLSGTATVTDPDGNVSTPSAQTKGSSLPAPLPMVGLRGGWVVAPNWYIDGQANFFKVNIDGYDGRWTDVRVGATWMFHRSFGVGLGYNWFDTSIEVDRDDFDGNLDLGYSGLQAYLTATF